ncbi:exosortase system-associated protein, TIGR04073 family [Nitrosomonas ureae]|uniref:exosortase system-associated protein, TIGR04073 family n=1 Tax=Nitrosomonas ureae TaxID=44577 RepID=UPI0027E4EB07|nr:exosortase system-associated protein, TIGR04073 family [Nitrosomonas ureae]
MTGFTNKISQGVANIAFGFIEIPKNIINITNDQNIFVGMNWGVIRGVAHGVSRTLVGGTEFLTYRFQRVSLPHQPMSVIVLVKIAAILACITPATGLTTAHWMMASKPVATNSITRITS